MAKAKIPGISVDIGIVELAVNDTHVLRINPADVNLGSRFQKLIDDVPVLIGGIKDGDEEDKLESAYQADQAIKARLGEVFPWGNDFDEILDRVNIMSPTDGGTTVLENLITAITPIVEQYAGTRIKAMQDTAKEAARKAAANREQRRVIK